MKNKFLFLILSVMLLISFTLAIGCKSSAKKPESIETPAENTIYNIFFDDVSLIHGQSFTLDAKLVVDGEVVDGIINYQVADSLIASIENGKLKANKIGTTTITAIASYNGKQNVASKTVNCSIGNEDGIVVNAHEYKVYISDNIHGQSFDTTKTVYAEVFVGGNKIEGANVVWNSGNQNIVTINDEGIVTAVSVGKTYIEGTYEQLKTVKIPVEVAIPVLKTDTNVVLDTRLDYSPIDSNRVLGNGKVAQKLVDVETGKEIAVNNNAIPTDGFKVGEYRYIVYDSNNLSGCEVNLIVADYVVNDKNDFQNLAYNAKAKYVAIATDLEYVGDYEKSDIMKEDAAVRTFTGVFNGLGHTIEGLNIVTNGMGIFGYADSGATFKNVSFINTSIKASNAGIFFFQSSGKVVFDNIHVQVKNLDTSLWSSGALYGMNFYGQVNISNSIIEVEGKGLLPSANGLTSNGAISGRAKTSPVFVNTYIISNGTIVADDMASQPHSQAYKRINILPIIYKTTDDFIEERFSPDSSMDFSNYNNFWDLSKDVPCFK